MEDFRNFFKTQKSADIFEYLNNKFKKVNSVLVYKKPHHDEVRVYRACPQHVNCAAYQCNCLAIKLTLIKEDLFDLEAAKAHELLTLRLRRTQGAAHFNKLLGFVRDTHTPRVVLASEYETLYWKDCTTLDDVIKKKDLSAIAWKAITFQFIAAFSKAQQRLPGFCHNDTHSKNLLLVPNKKDHVCYAISAKRRKVALKCPFLLLAIDFDLMTSDSLKSMAGKNFFQYTPGNTILDFFRFALSVKLTFLHTYREKRPAYWKDWHSFVRRYLPPAFLMEGDQRDISAVLDPNGAIPTKRGGEILQDLYGPHKSSILLKMLDDPYFDELVV